MARPQNKEQLAQAAVTEFDALKAILGTLSPEQLNAEFAFEDRDRNVRDVIMHLIEWHRMLLEWVQTNTTNPDANASFLPEPYNWKTYGLLNQKFRERHQGASLDQALAELDETHAQVLALINGFSDAELFTKKYFPWTGTTSLGSYCVSATSSHYVWAVKKLKQHMKASI